MFHTLITLAYTIPGLYLFLRLWSLFIEKKHRLTYVIIFAIIYSLYPISNAIENNSNSGFSQALATITNYLLPFFLYLFLFTLAFDIALFFTWLYRLTGRRTSAYRKPGYRGLLLVMALAAAVLIYGVINFNTIRITQYNIAVPAQNSHLPGIRIAFVSDTHFSDEVPSRFVTRFVEKTNALKPDVVLFGGDIVEGRSLSRKAEEFASILQKLDPVYGVYGVLGNHDGFGRSNELRAFYKMAGIRILQDTAVISEKNFAIAGRRDRRESDRMTAAGLVNTIEAGLPIILLDHRPDDFNAIEGTRADIVLCGHSHHGQLFPINLITNRVYELSYGYLKKNSTNFIVSSGLRLWGPPVRTVAKSEIVVLDVKLSMH